MAAIHETAYPRIKPNLSRKELKEIFTTTEDELFLLNSKTKRTLSLPRLGFMITLKCYQYLGRPICVKKLPEFIKNYLVGNLDIKNDIDLTAYDTSARKRHVKIIRDYSKINSDKKARRKNLN